MERNKETATGEFLDMIKNSWTWARLTDAERARFLEAVTDGHRAIIGTWAQRWDTLNALYHAFLLGLEYTAIGWRETEKETPLF